MSSRQAELERKIDRLEAQIEAQRGPPVTPAIKPTVEAPRPAPVIVPKNLTTVRLAPPPAKKPPMPPTGVSLREPDAETAQQLLAEAEGPADPADDDFKGPMESISTGDVERGVQGLLSFAERFPRDARAPQALLQAGVGQQASGDLQGAVLSFEKLSDDYPLATQAPEAMLRLGDCQLKLKRAERAREVYAKVMSRYPGTPAARQAEAGLKSLSATAAQ